MEGRIETGEGRFGARDSTALTGPLRKVGQPPRRTHPSPNPPPRPITPPGLRCEVDSRGFCWCICICRGCVSQHPSNPSVR